MGKNFASGTCGFVLLSALALTVLGGCYGPARIRSDARIQRGIVYVLPGIEGPSRWNRDIVYGLAEGGVGSAIEVYDWTTGLPGGFVFNLASYERNLRQAAALARKIVAYRERYPGRPVYLVGHSGGAGIAIMAIEALPPGRQIDMAILLAPALSPEYDLRKALQRTRHGVVNFYSELDLGLLGVGTTIFGSIDREHGASAGAVGFDVPSALKAADRELYDGKLRQVKWSPQMRKMGVSGTHSGWTSRSFVRDYLAPLISESEANHPLPKTLFQE
ncbi:MAG: alpha/beta fold hydrolase [Phycisphaerae bacterium]